MSRTRKICLLAVVCLSFVLAQTPVQAAVTQQKNADKPSTVQMIETVAQRMSRTTHESPTQVADDLKLLSPEEVNMLAANPQMMQAGGRYWGGGDRAVDIALIVAATVIVVAVIVAVAVTSCD